ncbi:unnamed protein product [Caenorhabditis brenneri]
MSYCNDSFYLDTSEFQSLFLHSFGLIAIPIHLLGAYCIMLKTPIIVLYWMIPDQSATNDVILARINCITPYIQLEKVFLLSNTTQLTSVIITIILSFFGVQIIFFAALTWWLLKRRIRETLSDHTINLQKQFLKALVLQMALPAIIMTLPSYHLIISVWSNFYHQYLNNISLIVISTHGMFTTIVMLFIHAPYRQFLMRSSAFRENALKIAANKPGI